MKKIFFSLFITFLVLSIQSALASSDYLTYPFLSNQSITSWFDHNNPTGDGINDDNNNFVRYDGLTITDGSAKLGSCTPGYNCYDAHNGIDFGALVGTDVLATAPGIIQSATFDFCNGNLLKVWHPDAGYSTLYAHLDSFVVSSGTVERSRHIAESGNTGPNCSRGAHLHFGVRDEQTGGNVMDPYGWSGSGTDPWSHNQGYLWTTNPPSLKWPITNISGTISSNTTFTGGSVYLIDGVVTVSSGVTLTIDADAVIKFKDISSSLIINGTLDVNGVLTNPVYFTSFKDDSIGGDTNNDGSATTPVSGDWERIKFNFGSAGNFEYTVIRYGGYIVDPMSATNNSLVNDGGIVDFNNSSIYYSDSVGISQTSGSMSISESNFHNSAAGLQQEGGSSTITNSEFYDNSSGIGIHGGILDISNSEFHHNNNYGTSQFSGDVEVTNSEFYENGTGIFVWRGILDISNNDIHDNDYGIEVADNPTVTISSNDIHDNDYGVYKFISFVFGSSPLELTSNKIRNNNYGLHHSSSIAPIISNNSFVNNIFYGVYNNNTSSIDASNNWWDSTLGPTHSTNPLGNGDEVSNDVTFIPWLLTDPNP